MTTKLQSNLDRQSAGYLGEIDGLRAIAVLAVIVYHFNESLIPSGFLGVDIFFVISGYVISASLASRASESLKQSLIEFYARRVKRLMPALMGCVLVTGILACIFSPRPGNSIVTGIAALFGLANLNLFRLSTDYFSDAAISNFFTQTWSLGVEEQFYFLFPVVYLLLTKHQQKDTVPHRFLIVMVLCSSLSLLAYFYASNRYPDAAFFLLPFRFWEISIGVLVFHGATHYGHNLDRFRSLDSRILVAFLLLILLVPKQFQTISTIAIVIVTGLLITSIHLGRHKATFLEKPLLKHFGQISYSLYLWHWSVLVLSYWTIGVSLVTVPVQLALIYFISLASYHCLERPLRHRQWGSKQSLEIVYGMVAAIFLSGLLVYLLDDRTTASPLYAGAPSSKSTWTTQSTLLDPNTTSLSTINSATVAALEEFQQRKTDCHLTPEKLDPTHRYYGQKRELGKPFFSNCLQSSNKKLILIGDSFSNVIADHIFVAAHTKGYEVLVMFGYGCPFPVNTDNVKWGKGRCGMQSERIQSALNDYLKPGDILVIRANYQSTDYSHATLTTDVKATSFMDQEIDSLQAIARSNNATFVIVGTNGTLNQSMACTKPHWFNSIQCPANELDFDMRESHSNQFVMKLNQHLVKTFHDPSIKSYVIDPIAILCVRENSSCPIYRDGRLFYRENDYSHLTASAMDFLYPSFVSFIESGHD